MLQVLLVIHLLIALALIGVVLLQRSEGGALGIGGGGGGGMAGLMTGRSTANLLTRTTAILAAAFMIMSIALTILGKSDGGTGSIVDVPAPAAVEESAPAEKSGSSEPSVPVQ